MLNRLAGEHTIVELSDAQLRAWLPFHAGRSWLSATRRKLRAQGIKAEQVGGRLRYTFEAVDD